MLFLRLVSKSSEIKKELLGLKKGTPNMQISVSQNLETALKKIKTQPIDFLILDVDSLNLDEQMFFSLQNFLPPALDFSILLLANFHLPSQQKFIAQNNAFLHDVFIYEKDKFSFSAPMFAHFIYRNCEARRNLHELHVMRSYNDTLQEALSVSSQQKTKPKSNLNFAPFFNSFIESEETKTFIENTSEAEKILLMGEAGLQQDEVARYFHSLKFKKITAPFISLDISRIAVREQESILLRLFTQMSSLLSSKNNQMAGTLYLSGIENISWDLQGKLLKFLHERSFVSEEGKSMPLQAFIIFSYHGDLSPLVNTGIFRQDLFSHLKVNMFQLKSVRAQKESIEPFLLRYHKDADPKLIKKIAHVILDQDCLGNADELISLSSELLHNPISLKKLEDTKENEIKNISEGNEKIEILMQPLLKNFLREKPSKTKQENLFQIPALSLEDMEKQYITYVLEKYKGNISESSRALRITRKTLYAKISRYNIKVG